MKHRWLLGNLIVLALGVMEADAQVTLTIRDFSPKWGRPRSNTYPGDTIRVLGSNFSADPVNHRANFGPIRGRTVTPQVVNDSVFRTVAAFGATYEPITITRTDLRSVVYTRLPFKVAMPGSAKAFEKNVRIGSGRMVAAGFLIEANAVSLVASAVDSARRSYLAAYTNLDNGTPIPFTEPRHVSLATQSLDPLCIARGDFDGDAYQDVAMATNEPGNERLILFHTKGISGSVEFDSTIQLILPGRSSGIAIRDLNADGLVDIALAFPDSNLILVFRNSTTALRQFHFESSFRLAVQGEPSGIAIGDINGDALPEIVATEKNLNHVVVFRNDGYMNFTPVRFPFGVRPDKIRLLDVDGGSDDSDPLDIVTTNPETSTLTARLNTTRALSAITFGSEHTIASGGSDMSNFDVGDLNADLKQDIVVANHRRNSVSVFFNTTPNAGAVSFSPPAEYAAGRGPNNVVIADLDKDGYNDLLAAGGADSCAQGACERFSDVVMLRGRPFLPGFFVDRSVVSFAGTLIGSVGVDSIVIANNSPSGGTSTLDVTASLVNSRFRVAPAGIQSITPGRTQTFIITYAPTDTLTRSDTITITHTASELPHRIVLHGKGVSAIAPPALVVPSANSTNVDPQRVVLSWSRVVTATGYHLHVALDSTFRTIVADTKTSDTSASVSAIAFNAKYYWRVASRDANGDGRSAQARSFSTATAATVTAQIGFPSQPSSATDYRLVSFPGVSAMRVGDILSGEQNTDWRIFKENGANPPDNLTELSTNEQLKSGEAYLMVKRGAFNFSRSVLMPPLETNGTVSVPVEKRWILVGNPFNKAVPWESVRSASGLSASTVLYTYLGKDGTKRDTSGEHGAPAMQPFVGYLVDNSFGVDSLRFPFPFSNLPSSSVETDIVWQLQLALESESGADHENFIGIAPSALQERDHLEGHKPPLFLEHGTIAFSRPQWDRNYSLFNADFRPTLSDGQVWEFDVHNERLSRAAIRIIGVEHVPSENSIVLVNCQNSIPWNVRSNDVYEYQTVNALMRFKLIVGTPTFIANTIREGLPTRFALEQNYPNPFNPSTSIAFSVPHEADVRLDIVSLLGERVAIVGEGHYQPGNYTVIWNSSNASDPIRASGVYFSRLVVDGKAMAVRKMLLLK